jgi:hypothetical protein
MVAYTFYFDDQSKLAQFIDLAQQLKVPFYIGESDIAAVETDKDDDVAFHKLIQSRIIEKYVKTGEWDNMDEEDKLDTVLLERMLYYQEIGYDKALNAQEHEEFKKEMMSW